MRVGLMGFGRTGRAVASTIVSNRDFSLAWALRRSDKLKGQSVSELLFGAPDGGGLIYPYSEFSADELFSRHPVDVVIDFSSPDGIDYYGDAAARRGVSIVTAVSHYDQRGMDRLRALGRRTAVLWSPNITVGINFLILAAQTLQRIAPWTDVEILEEHFRAKEGTSGTAKVIADALEVDPSDIKSVRAGGIVGVHEVLFGFPQQTVRIRHESISREAFANGAIFAAQRLVGMPHGLYKMEDLLLPTFVEGFVTREATPDTCPSCGVSALGPA